MQYYKIVIVLYHDLSTEPNLPFHCCVGIIGGLTSVITSTVEGVKSEGGVSGFFSGLGKGLVGTVTKPVAGALDFASETAQTVREMASLSNRYFPLNYVFRSFFLLWKKMTDIFRWMAYPRPCSWPFSSAVCQSWCPRWKTKQKQISLKRLLKKLQKQCSEYHIAQRLQSPNFLMSV